MCAALVAQRADIEPFIDGMSFEDYVNEMSEPETWGGEPELAVAAIVLGLPIVVYQQEKVRRAYTLESVPQVLGMGSAWPIWMVLGLFIFVYPYEKVPWAFQHKHHGLSQHPWRVRG